MAIQYINQHQNEVNTTNTAEENQHQNEVNTTNTTEKNQHQSEVNTTNTNGDKLQCTELPPSGILLNDFDHVHMDIGHSFKLFCPSTSKSKFWLNIQILTCNFSSTGVLNSTKY